MGDCCTIFENWRAARAAEEARDYAIAARLYRICDVVYECGELNYYDDNLAYMARHAGTKYRKMLRKLPKAEAKAIWNEAKDFYDSMVMDLNSYDPEYFFFDYRSFVHEQNEIIEKYTKDRQNQS